MSAYEQPTIGEFATTPAATDREGLDELSDARREVWVAVELEGKGVRQVMRDRGLSSPGTVSNQLADAREKLGRVATADDEDGGRA